MVSNTNKIWQSSMSPISTQSYQTIKQVVNQNITYVKEKNNC